MGGAGLVRLVAGLALASFLALSGQSAHAASATGPSFDCAKPSEIEAVVCGDVELSAADRRLAAFYAVARPGALGVGSNQLATQREWLKTRDKDCAKGAWRQGAKSLRACILGDYDVRLEDLAVATLFVQPDISLTELRRIDPEAAPVYEAVLRHVLIADPAARTRAVAALLAPSYAALAPEEKTRFAGQNIATARDAAASDEGVARFFDMVVMFQQYRLTWPCAALIKRPGLLPSLGSLWGGAIDGAIPESDCEATLPPLPVVFELSQKALRAQPPCDGTIRFSMEREYSMLQAAVRLHRPDIWAKSNPGPLAGDAKAFAHAHRAQVAKAQTDLTAYYAAVFKASPSTASADAASAMTALIDGAFGEC